MHMLNPIRVTVVLLVAASIGCSSGGAESPTSPSRPSMQSITTRPSGVGVLHNTEFEFTAVGGFPSSTQFVWQFGDGSTVTTTTPVATKLYSRTGSFAVSVEARAGSNSSASTTQVSVRDIVGRWVGTVSGHTRYPPQRPVPMTSFELTVNSAGTPGSRNGNVLLGASWADNAGCRWSYVTQSFRPGPTANVSLSVESLSCTDGDFILQGTADPSFNTVEGTCSAGPNCRFSMTRR